MGWGVLSFSERLVLFYFVACPCATLQCRRCAMSSGRQSYLLIVMGWLRSFFAFHRRCRKKNNLTTISKSGDCNNDEVRRIDLIHKSQNAPVLYPIRLHLYQKCAHFCFDWNIVGYGTGAFKDLRNWFIGADRKESDGIHTDSWRMSLIPYCATTILNISKQFCASRTHVQQLSDEQIRTLTATNQILSPKTIFGLKQTIVLLNQRK